MKVKQLCMLSVSSFEQPCGGVQLADIYRVQGDIYAFAVGPGVDRFHEVTVTVEDKFTRLRVETRRRPPAGRHVEPVAVQQEISLRRYAGETCVMRECCEVEAGGVVFPFDRAVFGIEAIDEDTVA